MSRVRKTFSSEFKAKVALEAIKRFIQMQLATGRKKFWKVYLKYLTTGVDPKQKPIQS